MIRTRGAWVLGLLMMMVSGGEAGPPAPYLTLSPTAGLWAWDEMVFSGLDVTSSTGPVLGGRVGFTPVDAFAGEAIFLTGTNDVALPPGQGGGEAPVRGTQIELSFLVNFRSLVNSPIFPFLSLGGGGVVLRGDAVDAENNDIDASHFAFHLGGGLKAELASRIDLRFNIRDTFYTESQGEADQENQVTVDAVELTLSLDYKIPLQAPRGSRRLR